MNLVTSLFRSKELARTIQSLDDYIDILNTVYYQGNQYQAFPGLTKWNGVDAERVTEDFIGYVRQIYKDNGVVFAVEAVRMAVFSSMRFCYQRMFTDGPSELWGDQTLKILEHPEQGKTTQDMAMRSIQDADAAGNSYNVMVGGEVVRMRPDWTLILMEPRMVGDQKDMGDGITTRQVGWRRIGYAYFQGGLSVDRPPAMLPARMVAHFAPHPDPENEFRGMSWMTPIIRDVIADKQIQRHKISFLENSATPTLIMKVPETVKFDKFSLYVEKFRKEYGSPENAGKPLFVGSGADATVVGSNWRQMDLKSVQGGGETRICVAGGVPAVLVGVSEGLSGSSLNQGNYGMARRALADIRMHPYWQNYVGSFEHLMPVPVKNRLWYDVRHVPFLREDNKDAAEITNIQVGAIRQAVDAGYEPKSAQRAIASGDVMLMQHTGKLSVQLQDTASDPEAEAKKAARQVAEVVQKVYLGVTAKVLTKDEAREIINDAGGNLTVPAPLELTEAEPAALPVGDDGGGDGGNATGA